MHFLISLRSYFANIFFGYSKLKDLVTMTPLRFSHIRSANKRNLSLLLAAGRRANAPAFAVLGYKEVLQIIHDYAEPERKDYFHSLSLHCALCSMSRPDLGNSIVVESLHSDEEVEDTDGADCRILPGHEYSGCLRSMSNIFTRFFASWVSNPEVVTFTSLSNWRSMGEVELRRVFLASFLVWLNDETIHWPVAEQKCFCGALPGDTVFWMTEDGICSIRRYETATEDELAERGYVDKDGKGLLVKLTYSIFTKLEV